MRMLHVYAFALMQKLYTRDIFIFSIVFYYSLLLVLYVQATALTFQFIFFTSWPPPKASG